MDEFEPSHALIRILLGKRSPKLFALFSFCRGLSSALLQMMQ